MDDSRTAALTGLGIGVALASPPGPIQAILLAETIRGGVARGLRVLLGASSTFAALLLLLALGVSVVAPAGLLLRSLKVVGGFYLLVLAVDAFKSAVEPLRTAAASDGFAPAARGSLAILLNPAGWIFLGAVASPLFAAAAAAGGRVSALVAAVALILGLAVGDLGVVLVGGFGIRRAHPRLRTGIRRSLAALLFLVACTLVSSGLIS